MLETHFWHRVLVRQHSTQMTLTSMPKAGATPARMVVVHTHHIRDRDVAPEQGLLILGEWIHPFRLLMGHTLYVSLHSRDPFLVGPWQVIERECSRITSMNSSMRPRTGLALVLEPTVGTPTISKTISQLFKW